MSTLQRLLCLKYTIQNGRMLQQTSKVTVPRGRTSDGVYISVFKDRLAVVGTTVRMFTMATAECGALVEDARSFALPVEDIADVEDALLANQREVLVCDRTASRLLVLDVDTATLAEVQTAMRPLGMAASERWGLVAVCGFCRDGSLLQFYRRDKDRWTLDRQVHLQGSVQISRLSFVHNNDVWPSSMLLFDTLGKQMMWAHFDWKRWQASVPLQKGSWFSRDVLALVEMTPGRQWLASTSSATYSLELPERRRLQIAWRSFGGTHMFLSMAMLPGVGCLSYVEYRYKEELLYLHSGPEWRAMQGMSLPRVAWMATVHRSNVAFYSVKP
jgi:hypothetical protein